MSDSTSAKIPISLSCQVNTAVELNDDSFRYYFLSYNLLVYLKCIKESHMEQLRSDLLRYMQRCMSFADAG